jgi:hypothetical protein
LDPDVAEAAAANDHTGSARRQKARSLLGGPVRGDPGVGERRNVFGLKARVELDERALAGPQVFGKATVAVQPRKGIVFAIRRSSPWGALSRDHPARRW